MADTGVLYALADISDRWHARVRDWWSASQRRVAIPVTVLPEVSYLLATRIGPSAELAFIRSLADGELELEQLERDDVLRSVELMQRYADMPLGFVEATVVAVAERLGTREVATTDRRHFGVLRTTNSGPLILVP